MERNRTADLFWVGCRAASLFAVAYFSTYAFSKQSRRAIIRRDGKCVASGQHEGGLEAAHIDHSRDNPHYDDPSNGRALCTKHHLEDHLRREGRNGLSENHNTWAINALRGRLEGGD